MFCTLLLLISPYCSDPVLPANVVTPNRHHSAASEMAAGLGDLDRILGKWAAASKLQQAPSRSQREILRLIVSTSLNGHAAMAIEKLAGHVDAGQLKDQFQWTVTETRDDRIGLEAIPKDDTERLFYRSIRVWLNSSNGRLANLQATDRRGHVCANWRIEEPSTEPRVTTVGFQTTVSTGGIVTASLQPGPQPRFGDSVPWATPDMSVPPSPAVLTVPGWSSVADAIQPTLGLTTRSRLGNDSDPIDLSPAPPEVAEILENWEAASREVKSSRLQFSRTVSNLVFEVEKLAEGELIFEGPDNVCFALRPANLEVTSHGGVKTLQQNARTGRMFRVTVDRAESWIWTANELLVSNDEDQTYERIAIAARNDSDTHSHRPVLASGNHRFPFLLDIHADQLRRDWSFRLLRSTNDKVVIEARPRTAVAKSAFSECWVAIDKKTWQTSAVKYFDPTGNLETVYTVKDREVNPTLPENCFHPDLKGRGYKSVAE